MTVEVAKSLEIHQPNPIDVALSAVFGFLCLMLLLFAGALGADLVLRAVDRQPLFIPNGWFTCPPESIVVTSRPPKARSDQPTVAPNFAGVQIVGKKIVFVLDKSLSMEMSNNWKPLKEEIERALRALQPDQSYAIYFFYGSFIFEPPCQLRVPTTVTVDSTLRWVAAQSVAEATDPVPALKHALENLQPDTIILMTDGQFRPNPVFELLSLLNPDKRTRIDTVAFPGAGPESQAVLTAIAAEYGGSMSSYNPHTGTVEP